MCCKVEKYTVQRNVEVITFEVTIYLERENNYKNLETGVITNRPSTIIRERKITWISIGGNRVWSSHPGLNRLLGRFSPGPVGRNLRTRERDW